MADKFGMSSVSTLTLSVFFESVDLVRDRGAAFEVWGMVRLWDADLEDVLLCVEGGKMSSKRCSAAIVAVVAEETFEDA